MPEIAVIQVETDGDHQIVRLPEGFRLPNGEVEVRRSGRGVLLEPPSPRRSPEEIRALFAELDKYKDIPFMPDGREQPPMPDDDDLPSLD